MSSPIRYSLQGAGLNRLDCNGGRGNATVTRGAPMLKRLLLSIGLLVATLALLPAAAAVAPPQRIIAVGDLHGDFSAWIDIARAAGLVDGAITGRAATPSSCRWATSPTGRRIR